MMAVAALSAGAASQSNPLWLRNTALSPDGKTIAFTWRGDIYTVPTGGGVAHQITSNEAYDTAPVWSPDGRQIAFSSMREGSMDVYITDAEGGAPMRLTTHSGTETPLAFADNNTVIFAANIMPSAEAINGYVFGQLYTVPAAGGRPRLLLSLPSGAMSVDNKGRILYQDKKGYEDAMRKHERSAGTSDIWLVEGALSGNPVFRQLTTFNGHDLNPQWTGADSYVYVSEQDGTLNVYSSTLSGGAPRQLTHLAGHPVRSLTAAADGTLAFSWDGEIYTMARGAAEPGKVSVTIVADKSASQVQRVARRSGASSIAVSPSGKEVAFVVRGDVYVANVEYGTTRQITATPGQERDVVFAPDGRSVIYDSERDGKWQIYRSSIKNPAEKAMAYATELEETPLTASSGIAFQPRLSPDGRKLAYLENRTTLRVKNLDSGTDIVVMPGKFAYSYTDGDVDMVWNPTSEWLLFDGYIGTGGWNNADVAAVKADGTQIIDLTESGYSDGVPKWTPDGKGVLFVSDKNGYRSHGSWGATRDVYAMWLDPGAYDDFMRSKEEVDMAKDAEKAEKDKADKDAGGKSKKSTKKDAKAAVPDPVQLTFDGRRDRKVRLTGNSSSLADYYLNKDMDQLYYLAAFEGDYDLWVMDLKKREPKILVKKWGFGPLVPDSTGGKLFSTVRGGIKSIDLKTKEVKTVSFTAKDEFDPAAERAYMFDHMEALVENKFHDTTLHGTDWQYYTDRYREFLPYVDNPYDFALLLSEVLGELNASHTGGRAYSSASALNATAYMGAFFDDSYTGDGLRISEVIARGPIALKSSTVKSGDVIVAIDGERIPAGQDWFPLMAGKAGQRTRIQVRHADGSEETVVIKPVSQGAHTNLLYERWKDRNRAIVDSVSGGRVAYVHIEGMDSESFRSVYDDLLGKYRNHDAVVVDTRYNGGGWLHNDVVILLSGRKYVDYVPRGNYIGSDPFSQWTKPSVMLINESNYSDAHGTPYAYHALGVGKLVGAPVPGTMTAVWWERQVDPSIVFGVPQVTSIDVNGKVLENQQLNPDILIINQPGDYLRGVDAQLIGATKELLAK